MAYSYANEGIIDVARLAARASRFEGDGLDDNALPLWT